MPNKKPKKVVTWHISPPADVYDAVSKLAESETRAIRNMVVVLLREAVVTRQNNVGGPG